MLSRPSPTPQANVEKAQAQALQASRDYARNRELTNAGLVAKSAYEQAQSSQSVASADVRSAQVALDKARQNLSFTNIYAPIDGVVVERNVQQGQTVAASLSAPQLFLIANDLSQMQILAQVGESDIAQIKEGAAGRVHRAGAAGPDVQGHGEAGAPAVDDTDNVVNYTVVVAVDNTQGKLLPGMTARVDFLTKSADNVLKVSNAALRFKPTDAELATLKTAPASQTTTSTTGTAATATAGGAQQKARTRTGSSNSGTLYYLDANGKLAVTHVRTGINDGTTTEISGKDLSDGMKVIAGTVSSTQTAQTTTAASPFQPGQQQQGAQRGGARGGF